MNRFVFFSLFLAASLGIAGCATAPKASAPVAQTAPNPQDEEITRLKNELAEQKVRLAEAEAAAAKAENDRREAELAKSSKPKDPYLK